MGRVQEAEANAMSVAETSRLDHKIEDPRGCAGTGRRLSRAVGRAERKDFAWIMRERDPLHVDTGLWDSYAAPGQLDCRLSVCDQKCDANRVETTALADANVIKRVEMSEPKAKSEPRIRIILPSPYEVWSH
jgi:hypothetical protein